ncbi:MAG TPA: beta-phosphoglucomutase [Firmicutes bacterium]|nr:beta-phosphoglucomutase [Bacillota bacterium]
MELAIFDLDGVIVDTAKYHYLAWKRLAEELEIPFTLDDNERLKGVSRMRSLQILLELGGRSQSAQEKERLAARKNTWYMQYIERMGPNEILPGVLPFLAALKQHGVKTALASASKNARFILTKLHLTQEFAAIVDGNSVSKAKPDPEGFLLAASKLGINPAAAVVFEDAPAGIVAAQRAGMLAVGIGSASALAGADLILPGFGEMAPELLLLTLRDMIFCKGDSL